MLYKQHGDREHCFIAAGLRMPRKVIAGYWKSEKVCGRIADWMKAAENRGLCSVLQNIIDHELKETGLYLILCDSQISFMENEVLGYKSPLFGRRTALAQIGNDRGQHAISVADLQHSA